MTEHENYPIFSQNHHFFLNSEGQKGSISVENKRFSALFEVGICSQRIDDCNPKDPEFQIKQTFSAKNEHF